MKIALINVLSTNVVALYFVIESDCLLFDENISSTYECLKEILFALRCCLMSFQMLISLLNAPFAQL